VQLSCSFVQLCEFGFRGGSRVGGIRLQLHLTGLFPCRAQIILIFWDSDLDQQKSTFCMPSRVNDRLESMTA
jgi:hypothetical protein